MSELTVFFYSPAAFPQMDAVSFQVDTADQEETDRYWNAIVGNGGQESQCGWCMDKWGINWQITPKRLNELVRGPNPDVARRANKAMLTTKKIDIVTLEAVANAD